MAIVSPVFPRENAHYGVEVFQRLASTLFLDYNSRA